MRIGINMPLKDTDGEPLNADRVALRASMVEAAGLNGIWMQDSLDPGTMRPDPLMWLLTACVATRALEVGTSIYIAPIHSPVDLAQRFLTLQALTNGRFTAGVGAGSRRASYDAMAVDGFDDRFRRLHEHMDTVRRLCNGETVGTANLDPWPSTKGGPRVVLGAWHSDISLRRAATSYDGWMCSASRTNYVTMAQGIATYRKFGGKRAMVATCPIDLSAPTERMRDDDSFHLRCDESEAARRLGRLSSLGFDDVLLVKADHTGTRKMFEVDFDATELETIRGLVSNDPRKAWE